MASRGRKRIAQRHPILGGANDLDQLMLGDGVAGLAAENVVQAGLGTAFIPQPQKVLEGIDDPPACKEVDRDVQLVLGRHIGRAAVPLEDTLVDAVDVLDEGHLELEAGRRHGGADRSAELGDDRLLDLADGVERAHQDEHGGPEQATRRAISLTLFMVASLLGVEMQKWQNAARLRVDNDLGAETWHALLAGSRCRCDAG